MLKRVLLLSVVAAVAIALGSCALFNKAPVVVVTYTPSDPWSGDTVYLDAGQSTDADGDALTYAWSLAAIPPTSTTTIDSDTGSTTSFHTDATGTYTVHLVVSDGTNDVPADIDIEVTFAP